jgi:hypothetical protein
MLEAEDRAEEAHERARSARARAQRLRAEGAGRPADAHAAELREATLSALRAHQDAADLHEEHEGHALEHGLFEDAARARDRRAAALERARVERRRLAAIDASSSGGEAARLPPA